MWGSGGIAPPFLTLVLDSGEPVWTLWRTEKSCTCQELNPAVQPIAILNELTQLFPYIYKFYLKLFILYILPELTNICSIFKYPVIFLNKTATVLYLTVNVYHLHEIFLLFYYLQ
jgi:hypothetical protein